MNLHKDLLKYFNIKLRLVFICIFILISSWSCYKAEEKVYFTDDGKAVFNTYNQGDSFFMIKNNQDTINFIIINKVDRMITTTQKHEHEEGYFMVMSNNDISGLVEIRSPGINPVITMKFSRYFDQGYSIYFTKYTKHNTMIINNTEYYNVLLMTNDFNSDTLYFSTVNGFAYIKLTDGTTYKLIE